MLRVAFVRHRSVRGGAERSLATLCRRLPDAGIEPLVVLGEPGPLEGWLAEAGCAAVVASPMRVGDAVMQAAPDAVVGLGAEAHLWSARAAERLGVPQVWWQELTPRGRPSERAARAEPTAAIACCNRFGVARERARSPRATVVQLAPALDVDAVAARRDTRPAARAALGWEHATVLGMVARLDPAKGQDVLLDAGRKLLERGRDVRLLLVGGAVVGHEGELPAELRRQARDLGERVRFVEHVDDPVPWQAALDVSVHPSRHESFCLSLLEALALGTPVVATRTDGARELLDDDGEGDLEARAGGDGRAGLGRRTAGLPIGRHGGLLVDDGADALADGIDAILADAALAARLAERGRARARGYGADRTAAALAALIATLRAGSGRDGSSAAAPARPAAAAAAHRGPVA